MSFPSLDTHLLVPNIKWQVDSTADYTAFQALDGAVVVPHGPPSHTQFHDVKAEVEKTCRNGLESVQEGAGPSGGMQCGKLWQRIVMVVRPGPCCSMEQHLTFDVCAAVGVSCAANLWLFFCVFL